LIRQTITIIKRLEKTVMLYRQYYDKTTQVLERIINTQSGVIVQAAEIMAKSIADDGIIHVFGCSHAGIIAQEAFYRAGGLVPISPVFDDALLLNRRPVTQTSETELISGYAAGILNKYSILPQDIFVIHSNSGRNTVSVEMAQELKDRGIKVIAITSLEFSSRSVSRAPGGKRLFEVSDIVIDNCGVFGDAILRHPGMNDAFCATSSIAGCMIINMLIAQTIEDLLAMGIDPPVFRSANVDGGFEHNKLLCGKYKDRVSYL
jgi:uncharacterized phosphosugar-binding protein